MFANRYTVFVDACVLASALKRNILLSLAAAEFFRLRWSNEVLDETERAIADILAKKGQSDAADHASRATAKMREAFDDAMVTGFEAFLSAGDGLPDTNDRHVLAAAIRTQAATIVTDNLRDFPNSVLEPFNIEPRSADNFIADTIELDEGKAIAAIRTMRERLNRPAMTPEHLLLKMEAAGLAETANLLGRHIQSL